MNCSPTTTAFQENRIRPFIDEYIRIGKLFKIDNIEQLTRSTKVTVKPTNLRNNYGVCYPYLNEIILDNKDFYTLPVENQEELMFHELTHCVLGIMGHTESGIMRAAGLYNPVVYKHNYNILINELFGCDAGDCVKIEWDNNKYKALHKEKLVTKEDIMNNKHAVVRFTASWCPPCKALAPIFDEVAAENPDVVTYVIDVDKNRDLASEMGIKGLPTMIKIKDNKVEKTLVGAQAKPEVEKLFK